jgi:hypothetical protein
MVDELSVRDPAGGAAGRMARDGRLILTGCRKRCGA